MLATRVTSESEFANAKKQLPVSIIFFYNHQKVTYNAFNSDVGELTRHATQNGVTKLYYLRMVDVNMQEYNLGANTVSGALFFKDNKLQGKTEDFTMDSFKKAFVKLTAAPAKQPSPAAVAAIKKNHAATQPKKHSNVTVTVKNGANVKVTTHQNGSVTVSRQRDEATSGCCIIL
ncbi:hypothetical protein GGI07_005108 [Coemansia sp. Benny D115]|nr:hypothetical protein GGI07_005108 [Coemansia sp. Benny D115]